MRIKPTPLALFGLVLAGCSTETVTQPPPAPVDWRSFQVHATPDAGARAPTARERAVAETYSAALESSDSGQLAARFDDDAHFAFPGMNDAHGRDSVVRAHQMLFGAFDQRKFSISRVWRTDSAQSLEWTMSGIHMQTWMGVSATHKPVTFEGLTILWTKDDGSITDLHVYFDVAVVRAQLGVGPKELIALPSAATATGTRAAPQIFEQTGFADEVTNVASARAALDALENNDQAAYLATMTNDVEVHTLEHPPPMRSKDEARAYFTAMHKAIGQLDTTIINVWGIARFAIVEYEMAGDQLGPIGSIPPQRDKVIRLHLLDVLEMRDAKIARVWRYDNPGEIIAPP